MASKSNLRGRIHKHGNAGIRPQFEVLESRDLLSGTQGGSGNTVLPQITSVVVDGTNWSPSFLAVLGFQGKDNRHGYSLLHNSPLHFVDANQIRISFNENVDIQSSDLSLAGQSVPRYAFSDFNYDDTTFTAIWTLAAPLGSDSLLLDLDGHTASGVRDSSGALLDGEWNNSAASPAAPSGNGVAGGDFNLAFKSLPADVNSDGVVNGLDISAVASTWLRSGTAGNTNGDGVVNGLDIAAIASNWLHAAQPSLAFPTTTTVSASATDIAHGQSVTVTATIASKYTPSEGTVTFMNNGSLLGTAAVVEGTAALNSSQLPLGTNVITAVYNDVGGIFAASNTTVGPASRIDTIAGGGGGPDNGDNLLATAAGLSQPTRTAIDAQGNLFIADTDHNMVREVNHATGRIITVAGNGAPGFQGDGDFADSAELNRPVGLAFDAAGDLFIADSVNNRIREVKAVNGLIVNDTSKISTVAGNGIPGYNGDNRPATSADLNDPYGLAQYNGLLLIADNANNRVRALNLASGVITTVAGNGTQGPGGDSGPATAAQVNRPAGVAVDGDRNLFIAGALDHRVREVNHATGVITTVAGNGTAGFGGDEGPATAALINNPVDVAIDAAGNLYFVDYNNVRIREVDHITGNITTVAGEGDTGFSGDGGPAISAQLFAPYGVTVDAGGDLFIADQYNDRVREVASGITVTVERIATATTVTATPTPHPFGVPDTLTATVSASVTPNEGTVTFMENGNTLGSQPVNNGLAVLATTLLPGNHEITAIYSDTAGVFAGSSTMVGANSAVDTLVRFDIVNHYGGVAVDLNGDVLASVDDDSWIAKLDHSSGVETTFAGGGGRGYSGDNGPATAAALFGPLGIAVDRIGNVFFADSANNVVREVYAGSGIIVTVAGTGAAGYNGDNIAATSAQLNDPVAVAVDSQGDLYIAEATGGRVRQVNLITGIITTLAGNGVSGSRGDGGPATAAQVYNPMGLAVDSSDNLFIADTGNNDIREVDYATKTIDRIAGLLGAPDNYGFSGDNGPAASAALNSPRGIAVDAYGNLYIGDTGNQRLRMVDHLTGVITTIADLGIISSVAVNAGGDVLVGSFGVMPSGYSYDVLKIASGPTISVNKLATTTSLVATPSVISFPVPVTLIATVTGTPTPDEGTVNFSFDGDDIGSAPVRGGVAAIVVFLPLGTDYVRAEYIDDEGNYADSQSTYQSVVVLPTVIGEGSGASESSVLSAGLGTAASLPAVVVDPRSTSIAATQRIAPFINQASVAASVAAVDEIPSPHAAASAQLLATWAPRYGARVARGLPATLDRVFQHTDTAFSAIHDDRLLDVLAANRLQPRAK